MNSTALRLGLFVLGVAACARWQEVKVPPEQALVRGHPRDVLVLLEADTTHWYSLPRAEIVGDSIIGHRKVKGQLLRLAVPIEQVTRLAVKGPDTETNNGLRQIGLFAGILAILVLGPIALSAIWGR